MKLAKVREQNNSRERKKPDHLQSHKEICSCEQLNPTIIALDCPTGFNFDTGLCGDGFKSASTISTLF
jgi:NAD(P)H-hydrate repair Nnr-like enzyme with NAD(P)H-hydrate epimerase domain